MTFDCIECIIFIVKCIYAGVAELADAQDLGSCGNTVQVQVLSPAPYIEKGIRKDALFHKDYLLLLIHNSVINARVIKK